MTLPSSMEHPPPTTPGINRVVVRPAAGATRWVMVSDLPPEGPRRVLNVVVAVVLLVLAAPVMLLLAIAVKLTSPGPVFYTQTRIGIDRRRDRSSHHRRVDDLGGKPFLIYKFRTMRVDAEQSTGAVWATENDPRVTWVGRFMRLFRLDELPQLLNVLQGEMNLVGPRPERPGIFRDLTQQIEHYQIRQRVRPGITGLAQINQQYDSCIEDVKRKVAYDIAYIERHQSVWEDVKIMLKTFPVVLFRRGSR